MTPLTIAPEVAAALRDGAPVVALESSLIAHGLPAPHNLGAALAAEAAVRADGALPATIALDGGRIIVGAPPPLLERLAEPGAASSVRKVGVRDIAPALASGGPGATTVSATLRIAHIAGIRVLATGGIGGVHPGASSTFDVSADIDELATTPLAVVCSGAKSLLDLPATLELLETRRIPVVGVRTDELPAFYTPTSGLRLSHRVEDAAAAAAVAALHLAIPGSGAVLFVQPPPPEVALDPGELGRLIGQATGEAARANVRGGEVTPWVLSRLAALTGGRTLRTNVALIVANARFAARLAAGLTRFTDVDYHRADTAATRSGTAAAVRGQETQEARS